MASAECMAYAMMTSACAVMHQSSIQDFRTVCNGLFHVPGNRSTRARSPVASSTSGDGRDRGYKAFDQQLGLPALSIVLNQQWLLVRLGMSKAAAEAQIAALQAAAEAQKKAAQTIQFMP